MLHEFAENLNSAMQSVGDHITLVHEDLREIRGFVDSMEEMPKVSSEQIDDLRKMVSRAVTDIEYFKTKHKRHS